MTTSAVGPEAQSIAELIESFDQMGRILAQYGWDT